MNRKNIIGLRMERQHLITPAREEEYIALYRDTQPGQNVYWHGFGQPPELTFRADFDDREFNRIRQAEHKLAKGRFQGGNLGWLDTRDMELFVCLCRKPLEAPTLLQTKVMELIEREGPMTIQQMKESSGLLVKELTPILHRLQEAFLVYEDQYDGEWDRGWFRFEEMFPDVNTEKYTRTEALKIVLQRFAFRMVWFDVNMAKSFYRLPVKDIKQAVEQLCAEGILTPCNMENDSTDTPSLGQGYILSSDLPLLEQNSYPVPGRLFLMHRNDILIKTQEQLLKKKYRCPEYEVLHYLIMDGEVHGVIFGKFKFGPDIVGDVWADEGYLSRRDEILQAVQNAYPNSILNPDTWRIFA